LIAANEFGRRKKFDNGKNVYRSKKITSAMEKILIVTKNWIMETKFDRRGKKLGDSETNG
jgi:hypothetical protein